MLFVGAAAVSILGRGNIEADEATVANSASDEVRPDDEVPAANRQSKGDKLIAATIAPSQGEPPQTGALPTESLRQAFAATPPPEIEGLKIASPAPPQAPPKPKIASKPPPQKPYALLSDAQIASIKERLKLSSSQETYWPPVEKALRAVARKIHAARQADPNGAGANIDPEAEEVQQLKSAAMPLLTQLREDQKREVRALARLIGLDKVAAAI